VAYKAVHGDCIVGKLHKTDDGYPLGAWVATQRNAYVTGKLSHERVARFEELGFVWDVNQAKWEKGYQQLVAYKTAHGNCIVARYKTDDGYPLGTWMNTQLGIWISNQRALRAVGKLSEERTARLEDLGFVWDVRESDWEEGYQHLVAYKAVHGDCIVGKLHKTDDGYPIGTWVARQRTRHAAGQRPKERTARLEELGFVWRVR